MILPRDEFAGIAQLPPTKLRTAPEAAFSVDNITSIQKTVVQGEYVEIHADTASVLVKYGTTACTTSNFDERVILGTYRAFVIPNNITALNFITALGTASVTLIRK
jgi:hypothetical protein